MYDARAEFKKNKILVRERTTITGNCPRFSSGAPYFPARPLTAAISDGHLYVIPFPSLQVA